MNRNEIYQSKFLSLSKSLEDPPARPPFFFPCLAIFILGNIRTGSPPLILFCYYSLHLMTKRYWESNAENSWEVISQAGLCGSVSTGFSAALLAGRGFRNSFLPCESCESNRLFFAYQKREKLVFLSVGKYPQKRSLCRL